MAGVDPRWRERATCAGFPAQAVDRLWNVDDDGGVPDLIMQRAAKRFCEECPVRMLCLADSLVRPVQAGIFGGLSYKERQLVAGSLRRASQTSQLGGGGREDVRVARVAAWLAAHPGVIDAARRRRAAQHGASPRRGFRPTARPADAGTDPCAGQPSLF